MNKRLEMYEEYSVSIEGKTVVFFFNSGLCLDHTPKITPDMHTHYHHELFTVFRGEMKILTEKGIDTITSGETVLIPAGLAHRPEYSEDIFRVTIAFVVPKADSSVLGKTLSNILNSDHIVCYASNYISQSVERILNYVHGDFEFKDSLIKGCLQELFSLLCQNGENTDSRIFRGASDSRNYRRYVISAILDRAFAIREFPIIAPTLQQISRQLNLSTKQTEREVKSIFGRTFGEQIIYLRLKKAQELLTDTDMSVNAISAAVGYSATGSFFRFFKKAFGMTPKEYRAFSKTNNPDI